ncbi:MAG: hypothetical protein ACLFU7_11850 [Armatimonadota bacterium]
MRRIAIITLMLLALGCAAVAQDAGDAAGETAEVPTLIPDWWERQAIVTIPPARPEAPVIDGKIGYEEWFYASRVDGFIDSDTGNLADLPVAMFVCYDEENVYVAVKIERPPMHPTARSTFPAGRHDHIWWQDDAFELVVRPGREESGVEHFFAFVGNSAGAWSVMRGALQGSGGDTSIEADWSYAAGSAGRTAWSGEVAIPIDQIGDHEPPRPGSVWLMDLMAQQVTPRKRITDLGLVWNLDMHGYRSPVTPRFVFVGEDGPILRPHGVGRLSSREGQQENSGMRMVVYNLGEEPIELDGRAQIFRAPAERAEGALEFYDAWDRVRRIRAGGRDVDPEQEIQAFRSEDDILGELNERFEFVEEREGRMVAPPRAEDGSQGAGYFALEQPVENGEYVVAWKFTDAESGEVVSAQVVPYAILPGLDLTLRPFFLKYGKLRAEASLANLELREGDRVEFALSAGDEEADAAAVAVNPLAESVHVYLDSSAIEPESAATVTARLLREDGAEVTASTANIERPADPEWWPNEIGRSEVVPPPFEPVVGDGANAFFLWQRRVEVGADGLPRSITARGTELLARPVTLDVGGEDPGWAARRTSLDERDAVYEATGMVDGLGLHLRSAWHYDGTGRMDLTVSPGEGAKTVDRLALEIPVSEEFARLAYHQATRTDPRTASNETFAGTLDEWFEQYPDGAIPFSWAVYLGAEDRGVQWFCEADRGWSNADEDAVIALSREDGAVVLQVNIVDEPITIEEPLRVTFGLTVTPVKDAGPGRSMIRVAMGRPAGQRDEDVDYEDLAKTHQAIIDAGANYVSTYINDEEHFGTPRIYNPEYERAAREYAEMLHDLGLKYTPYTGWGVNASIPQFDTFGQEMLAEPVKNIGWGCFLHNHASTFPDWWLWGARILIEETGLDGMYMDGMAMPRLMQNELDGYAWTDRDGNQRGSYSIWAIRDFIERLYVYTHVEAPKPAVVRNHYNLEMYCIGAFTDARVTGEAQYHAGDTVLGVHSTGEFRANFMTHLNGVATNGLWWNWQKLPVTRNEMHSMFLLHDVPMVVGGGIVRHYGNQIGYGEMTRPWVHLRKLRDAFADAEFVPYWEVDLIDEQPEGLLASAWVDRANQRALMVVSNLPSEPWSGSVTFDREALGIGADALPVDAMFDEPMPVDGDTVTLEIEPERYRVIIFGDRVPIPENPRID